MPRKSLHSRYPFFELSDDDDEDSPYPLAFGTSSDQIFTKMGSTAATSSPLRAVTRRCYSCRTLMPAENRYKSCAKCREKLRKRAREKKQQERMTRLQDMKAVNHEEATVAALPDDDLELPVLKKRKVHKSAMASSSASRRVGWETWPDVPLPAKIAAYVRARRAQEGSRSTIGLVKSLPAIQIPGVDTSIASWMQFQTRSAMHDAVTSAVNEYYSAYRAHVKKHGVAVGAPHPVAFFGHYSIVADPKIPHSARVAREVGYLKVSSKLHHSSNARSTYSTEGCSVLSYECYCARDLPQLPAPAPAPSPTVTPQPYTMTSSPASGNPAGPSSRQSAPQGFDKRATPASAPAAKPLKRQQSDLSKWVVREGHLHGFKSKAKSRFAGLGPSASAHVGAIAKPSNPPHPVAATPKKVASCGGRIHIMSIDDESHRLGRKCLGQRVVIVIDHGR